MKSLSLFALLVLAGTAEAQCQGGTCSLASRETSRVKLVVRTQTVTQTPRVACATVATSSTTQTVRVRQRIFRR